MCAVKKTLDELEFGDDFMFGRVMSDLSICKQFVEEFFQKSVKAVTKHVVQSTVQDEYGGKGVRFDVEFIGDDKIYDIEMQCQPRKELPKRVRYYQSVLDMHNLKSGQVYTDLRDTYIIFICDFYPFGKQGKNYAKLTQVPCLAELGGMVRDGTHVYYLSTHYDVANVPDSIKALLDYISVPSLADDSPELVCKIDKSVKHNKLSEEVRRDYMFFSMPLFDAREEGRDEGLVEGREQGYREAKRYYSAAIKLIMAGCEKSVIKQKCGVDVEEDESLAALYKQFYKSRDSKKVSGEVPTLDIPE